MSTDASTGLIEVLTDAISLDALKKRQLQRTVSGEGSNNSNGSGGGSGNSSNSSSNNNSNSNSNNSGNGSNGGNGGSLNRHFVMTYGEDTQASHEARWRFASSLAAYSVVCYVFAIKVGR